MTFTEQQLSMAAKAAGIGLVGFSMYPCGLLADRADGGWWEPHGDDSDALQLAAALKMNIEYGSGRVYAQHRTADGFWINSPSIPTAGRDMAEVYREAICACAALVGERMP